MNNRLVIALAALSFAAGFVVVGITQATPEPQGVHAQWVSSANTVFEQVAEADAVVRVRAVERLAPRVLTAKGADDDLPAAMIFTDTRFEVLEVYAGQVPSEITVLQTGGKAPRGADHPAFDLFLDEDPLFEVGTEHVLFLKNISGDPVQAPDRELFLPVNPAGRYFVDGGRVAAASKMGAAERPTQLSGLESQIRWAVDQTPRGPRVK
jgi:hypothetical protein